MCGIAGIHAYHRAAPPVDRQELRTIRDHMVRRGPDGLGEWFSADGRTGLGHRRLAIIELTERGAQPMRSADGRMTITFNGEIYNHRALRQQLQAHGHVFHSESDTEVLLHLYAQKGQDMLADLRGMFAFAIWDDLKKTLFMARDPYGIKPLYYANDGWTVRFASQVKALLTSTQVSRAPEPAGIAGFYLLGSVPEPYTLYQQVRALPAGSYLEVSRGGVHAPVEYASVALAWAATAEVPNCTAADATERVGSALLDSVHHHLEADVPVGAFLSAGIDSGALLALMTEAGSARSATSMPASGRFQAITLTFAEYSHSSADEAPLAAQVARAYGAQHHVRVVSEGEFRADLPRIFEAMDQPTTDGLNTWFVSKAARELGLKVAVSGLGGDELFGGYPSFTDLPRWVSRTRPIGWLPGLGSAVEALMSNFGGLARHLHPKAAGMLRYGPTYPGAYLLRRGLFLPSELPDLLGAETAHEGLSRLQPLGQFATTLSVLHQDGTSFGRVAALEAAHYMRNQLLRDTDWASMAHSVEVRTPLVDYVLLKRTAAMLSTLGVQPGKQLLADAAKPALPDNIRHRAKTGFTTPIATWQQQDSALNAWRKHPILLRPACPWARRWSAVVGAQFLGAKESMAYPTPMQQEVAPKVETSS